MVTNRTGLPDKVIPKGVIKIRYQSAYGTVRAYPVNDLGRQFARLLGRITLEDSHLQIIRDMGYSIETSEVTTNEY